MNLQNPRPSRNSVHNMTLGLAPNSLVDFMRMMLSSQNASVAPAEKRKTRGTLSQPTEWILDRSLYPVPTMPASALNAAPIDFVIQREEIEAGAVGAFVDRLMRLSDTQDKCIGAMQRLDLVFAGWEGDSREVHQIPEVFTFMRAAHAFWPYWLHFLRPTPDQLAVLILLLCDSNLVQGDKLRVQGRVADAQQVWDCLGELARAAMTLHAGMRLSDKHVRPMIQRIADGIGQIVI